MDEVGPSTEGRGGGATSALSWAEGVVSGADVSLDDKSVGSASEEKLGISLINLHTKAD